MNFFSLLVIVILSHIVNYENSIFDFNYIDFNFNSL